MSTSEVVAQMHAAVREPLTELGFRTRRRGILTTDLDEDVLGWVGLNTATKHHPDAVEVNPVVGVRHQAVERLVAELRGERGHPYLPPTISTPLGYVMPQPRYRAWLFTADATASVASDLAAAIRDHGVPFMASGRHLDALAELARQGLGHFLEYRLPVVLLLLDRRDEALEEIARSLDALGDRSDAAAAELRAFGAEFLRRYQLS